MTPPQPQDAVALFNQGLQQLQVSNYRAALVHFDSALAVSPKNPNIWEKRTLALQYLGRYTSAIASNKIALSLYSNSIDLVSPDEWFDLGYQQAIEGDVLGAIASFDKALEIEPDDAEAWYNRALALYNLGRIEEAATSFDKAVKLKPDDAEAWYSQGITLCDLGQFEEAVVSFDKALEIKPDDYQAWHNRTLALYNLGRLEGAIAPSTPQ
jgi:tetratricopeptide (TPR) repeat protein